MLDFSLWDIPSSFGFGLMPSRYPMSEQKRNRRILSRDCKSLKKNILTNVFIYIMQWDKANDAVILFHGWCSNKSI